MARGMGNMGNMQGMMQKIQKMQKELTKEQKNIEETIFEKSDANHLLTIKMNGKKEVTDLTISSDLIDPEDPEMLQDLLIVTLNELMIEIDETAEARLSKYTKGMNLPF
ncbi:nucleoid-associated protein [Globicatella sp. HMSC072A10]|uniref:YbaB/EbfC family nucleoid-associated protein n=1 Tax=Globicatella sp. HMSC072A10 TaxID=1739315 RepID=UPI0008D1F53F|nr:YbaB/EbfC family nucleoid-associated protein [Globicatella sp. HMSC072A10]OFK58015.1 nucleoid-associated protein [Globicatella sp. HMSC072A10]